MPIDDVNARARRTENAIMGQSSAMIANGWRFVGVVVLVVSNTKTINSFGRKVSSVSIFLKKLVLISCDLISGCFGTNCIALHMYLSLVSFKN